jgi:hypothetical protein
MIMRLDHSEFCSCIKSSINEIISYSVVLLSNVWQNKMSFKKAAHTGQKLHLSVVSQRAETVFNKLHRLRKNILCHFMYVVGHSVNCNQFAGYIYIYIYNSNIISIQPLGRFWQEPEPSQAIGMALAHCCLGKFLGVVCHCFPLPFYIPTFAARCLHIFNNASTPSSERWNCRQDWCPVMLLKLRLFYAI